jgi:hypothetical protein
MGWPRASFITLVAVMNNDDEPVIGLTFKAVPCAEIQHDEIACDWVEA